VKTGPLQSVVYNMIPGFEKIVEERIRVARKKGEFEDLPNAGKPLVFGDDTFIPEELRMAYKILKNADAVPPEIEIKKEILNLESLLSGMGETAEAYHLMKKLNFLIMRFNSLRGGRITFEIPQLYEERLARRFGDCKRETPDYGN
jgi:hypothetical protein